MKEKSVTSWRCMICGYIHHGTAPPEQCPVCGASADEFEHVEATVSDAPERRESDEAGKAPLNWTRVAGIDEVAEGTVKTVAAGNRTFVVTHFEKLFAILNHACPHQGGPLGEGRIEGGYLRCPWHGWPFHPITGENPGGGPGVNTYPCDVREDGIYLGLPEEPSARTVSDLMVETMVNWGVKHVFGMVGHSNLGLADAIRRQVIAGDLSYIGVRHEGAAAFAASAYAKLTGNPAACLSIAGPGATNLLTGLWDARMDRAPILALTGQVDTQVLGPGAFQEIDLTSAFAPVAAWSQTVMHSSNHAELMTLALKHAILKRDVGHLIFPNEVQDLPVDPDVKSSSPEGRLTPRNVKPPEESLASALDLLGKAKRPAIIVGHGSRFHMKMIIQLAGHLSCPVITTFKGKGLIPDNHPLACGVLGRSGTPVASHFMNAADLLVVFGASFSHHTGITPDRPTIQVDYDPVVLGKRHAVTVPVYGEIGITAQLLSERLPDTGPWQDRREEIRNKWQVWREEKTRRASVRSERGLNSAQVFAALSCCVPDNAVIAVDVGNNTYSFGRYFECKNQSVLMSGYLGSIGFGYPAAIGAWAAAPKRPIWAVAGDGGFGQYMGELCTAVKYGMKITLVLLNNHELGKISKEQRMQNYEVWETGLHNPDFSKYAVACGALGIRATKADQLEEAFEEASAYGGASLVEVIMDPDLV